jgi:methionyl-tRNA formyltransferase
MKVVFLTNKSARGAHILREMKRRGIPIEAVFIDVQRPTGLKTKFKKLKRLGPAGTLRAISRRGRRVLAPTELKMSARRMQRRLAPATIEEWLSSDFYRAYSDRVYVVDDVNGHECERLLREIRPYVIVLGGSRIIRKHIIGIPSIGVLNAHPGLLPGYRGVDVIPWAIYYGDPVGVTVHFVDEGVDRRTDGRSRAENRGRGTHPGHTPGQGGWETALQNAHYAVPGNQEEAWGNTRKCVVDPLVSGS